MGERQGICRLEKLPRLPLCIRFKNPDTGLATSIEIAHFALYRVVLCGQCVFRITHIATEAAVQ